MDIKEYSFKQIKLFKEEVTREIWEYHKSNENEKSTYQSIWDAVKVVSRGRIYGYKQSYSYYRLILIKTELRSLKSKNETLLLIT